MPLNNKLSATNIYTQTPKRQLNSVSYLVIKGSRQIKRGYITALLPHLVQIVGTVK